jgi:hypothetical protein
MWIMVTLVTWQNWPKKRTLAPIINWGVLTCSQHIFPFLAIGFHNLIKKKNPNSSLTGMYTLQEKFEWSATPTRSVLTWMTDSDYQGTTI